MWQHNGHTKQYKQMVASVKIIFDFQIAVSKIGVRDILIQTL